MKPLRQVFGETLARLGAEIPELVVLDADVSKSTKTSIFAKAYPDRFHDMGISEQDMLATAAGLATTGMIPVASTFAIFGTGRAWEQLRNSVCYPSLNVKLVATHGGITVGQDGGSHQSVEDLATTRVIPNLRVIVPADGRETAQVIEHIVREVNAPCYVRLPRDGTPDVHDENYTFALGKASRLREGQDITLCACGVMVSVAIEAAKALQAEGISAAVLNISSLKPIDEEALIQAARKTGALLTLEEHSVIGGLGGAVCEVVSGVLPVPVVRIGLDDLFGQSGSADELLGHYGLTVTHAIAGAKEAIALKAESNPMRW
ncbi:MAG: transketolase family protein [Deltaproteobacteria bacterium]|nr:transketolase family protein [Deltaproteobacteria bacterium]